MKRITLSILGLASVLLAGCVVTSVYPYYTAKDLIFDPVLPGTWSDAAKTNADGETWTFEKLAAKTYKLAIRENTETNTFEAHLFTLGGVKFLDVFSQERHEYATPTHILLRVNQLQPQLEMQVLNYEWLGKLVEAKPKAIRHIVVPKEASKAEDGGQITLTADTAELQKFVRKHLNNTNAWAEPMMMIKR